MKRALFPLVLLLAGLIGFSSFIVKDDLLNSLLEKLERFTAERPQEKVHLHLDKPYYSVGDDMWFKAYVVNAEENKLSLLGKVLYVELVDEQDSIRKTLTLPLENGLASGNINLVDSSFNAGTYQLRAYTNWMRNFDEDFLFRKQVMIGDALNDKLLVKASFDISPKTNETLLKATVSYTQLDKEPLRNQQVGYQLLFKDDKLFEGKGLTNENGELTINYALKKSYPVNELLLNTSIDRGKGNKITKVLPVVQTASAIDLQFFPEGGNLVEGLRSKVAFKAIGSNGLGTDVEGFVEDQDHQKVAAFQSEHLGMGLFAFAPEAGKQYTAVVAKDGQEKRFALPKAQPEGYVLSLTHLDDENLLLRISATPALAQNKEVVVVAQANGVAKYTARLKMDRETVSSKLPKNSLADGIVQVTLFSDAMVPLAERLVFIQPQKPLKVTLGTDKEAYAKRSPVNLSLQVANDRAEGVVGSFSVAVVHQDKVRQAEDDETTILSNLLLTSDLKGHIEKPNYYFTNINADKARQLDVLLLSQGWRRFKWSEVQEGKKADPKFFAENGPTLRGTITTLGNKPIPFGKINLFVPSQFLLIDTVADANGRFVFDKLDFPDSTSFILRVKNAKDRNNAKIVMDGREPLKRFAFASADEGALADVFVNYLQQAEKRYVEMSKYGLVNKKTIVLNEVEIKAKKHPPIFNSVFPKVAVPDYTIMPEKLQSAGNIANLLRGLNRVNIKLDMQKGFNIYGSRGGGEGRMLVLLDGQPITDISGINPSSLAGVQIVAGGAVSSGLGVPFEGLIMDKKEGDPAFGIVFLTTEFRRTKYNTNPPSGLGRVKSGYSLTKEFYSPNYEAEDKDKPMADLRSTIYWSPNLITDEKGNASMKFFTADEPGKYLVTLEGVALSGQLVRKTYSFVVK